MNKSYFPAADAKLLIWAVNYKNAIGIHGATLGLSVAEIAEHQSFCDTIINLINEVNDFKTNLKSKVGAKNNSIAIEGGDLRNRIAKLKMANGYTEAIGNSLGVISHSVTLDFVNFKPKIAAEYNGGVVKLKFKKLGVDGINIYHRKKGTIEWLFLARATKSPFDDHIVLATAGQPEHWEYRAFGVIDDAEIGIPSDIVEMVYGG